MDTSTNDLTIDNFTERTGFRFRISKLQAARIALTKLGDVTPLIGLNLEQAADLLDARNAEGEPLNWVEDALDLAGKWASDQSLTLTREAAFQEFLAEGKLKELEERTRPDVPPAVFLTEGLTLENFAERVKAAVGIARRFRVSREQANRIKAGSLTREQALAEVIAAAKAAATV